MIRKTTSTPAAPLRTAVYVRVSTGAQVEKGDSIDEQIATCTNYVNSNEKMVLQDVYIDYGISGQKLDRGDFTRLIHNVEAGEIDFIVFTKLDRWFRNLRHYLNTQVILDNHNVPWLAVSQPFYDTSTPQTRAFISQSMIFAELEAQGDGERVLNVFDYKYKRGEVLGGKAPLGYSIVEKHLQPNASAPIVLAIFEYYSHVGSLNATIRYMEQQHNIVTTQDNLKRSILTNKKYIGVFRDNMEYCPPIVPSDLFDDVQHKLKHNVKSSQRYPYMFSGLLFCSCCGRACSGFMQRTGRSKKTGDIYKYPAYRCRKAFTNRRCINRKIFYESTLEKYVLENIKPLLSEYIADYEIKSAPIVDNAQRRAVLQKKIDKLKELFVNDLITLDEFKRDKAAYAAQLEELHDDPKPIKDLSPLREFLKKDILGIYKTMTNEEKRYLWRSVIKEIRIDENKNIEIIFL